MPLAKGLLWGVLRKIRISTNYVIYAANPARIQAKKSVLVVSLSVRHREVLLGSMGEHPINRVASRCLKWRWL